MGADRAEPSHRHGGATRRRPGQRWRDRAEAARYGKERRRRDGGQWPQQLEGGEPDNERRREGKGEGDRQIPPLLRAKPGG
jgi:hypothetical protein